MVEASTEPPVVMQVHGGAMPPLVGRDALIERIATAVADPATRLLTLTGPGGIGKTSLAEAVMAVVAPSFPDGVNLIELAAERDPERLLGSVVQALGLEPTDDQTPLATLVHGIAGSRRLLILDNLEQLAEGTAVLVDLLGGCPGLTLLVTSRGRLRLSLEHEVIVPPLTLPDRAGLPAQPEAARAVIAASPAVALFARRASQANPGFALDAGNAVAVAEICRRLDGLPLALELGAARLRLLSPAALLARLDHRLDLLSGGPRDAPERHWTIRDTVTWSVDLLPSAERQLFACLAVFAGGLTVDDLAAVAVATVDGLTPEVVLPSTEALVDGALIQAGADANGNPRLTILESVRDVAAELLAGAGLTEAARGHHAIRYLAVAEREGPRLRLDAATQERVFFELHAEMGNIRVALAWLFDQGDATGGLRLLTGLDWFWTVNDYLREGVDWFERFIAMSGPDVPPVIWGNAHRVISTLYDWLDRGEQTQRAVDEAIRALSQTDAYPALAETLHNGAKAALDRGELGLARAWTERCLALAEHHRLPFYAAAAGTTLSLIASLAGDHAAAVAHGTAAIARFRAIDEARAVDAMVTLGFVHLRAEELPSAAEALAAVLTHERAERDDRGSPYLANIGHHLQAVFAVAAILARRRQRAVDAVHLLAAAAAEAKRTGVPLRPQYQALIDTTAVTLRTDHGEPWFHVEWERGTAGTITRWVALADDVLSAVVQPRLTGRLQALSPREIDVLRLIVDGCSDQAIADQLFISRRTASQHVSNVLAKLDLASRTAAATYATAHGLGPTDR